MKASKPGSVFALPRGVGSADALLIAQLAQSGARAPAAAGAPSASTRDTAGPAAETAGRTLAVITASAPDAQRLAAEIAFFAPGLTVRLFPDWETLPYDNFSPHQDLISERLDTLFLLQQARCDVVVATATTALHRLAPPSFLASHTFFFDKGQRLDEAALRAQLGLAGYEHVTQVVRPGEYSVRGGLIDLYPMGAALPYRLDLFGDEVESIRTFDPDTQRSLFPIDRVRLLPGREFPLDEPARAAFRGRWRERFEGDPSKASIYRDVGNGIASAGIEYWLPLFFDATATLFDYLPDGSLVLSHGDVDGAARRFGEEALQRHRFLAHDRERPLLRPEELFLDAERFFVEAARFGRWSMAAPVAAAPAAGTPDAAPAA
ncbi:MAG TPA: transcription-repair coupling factor, partial [Quisquiliibacterium sp.]|nr:transcription-repair coupling factor [Quisquiliibacterium sp.]